MREIAISRFRLGRSYGVRDAGHSNVVDRYAAGYGPSGGY